MKKSTGELMRRYVWLLNLIVRAKDRGITKKEIDDKWSNSIINEENTLQLQRKTFANYIKDIEEIFDVEIECVKINGESRYRLEKLDNDNEVVTNQLLSMMMLKESIASNKIMKERILFEDVSLRNDDVLTSILEAINESKQLKITHKAFKTDSVERVSILYPYCVKLREQRWYLLAYCEEKSAVRCYGLERIKSCEKLDISFDSNELQKYFKEKYSADSPKDYYRDFYGVITETNTQVADIKVRVFSTQYIKYFLSLPLHASQKMIFEKPKTGQGRSSFSYTEPADDAYADFLYHIHPTIDFFRKLLSFGNFVQIISPDEVVENYKKILYLSLRNYAADNN